MLILLLMGVEMGMKSVTHKELVRLGGVYGPFDKVLDVGCGNQIYRKFLTFEEYIGIDVRESGRPATQKVADSFFDGEHIPFPDNSFDLVICTEVLEHAVEPFNLLMEMKRVVKERGILLITVPSMWGEHEVPYDFRRYTSYGIKNLVGKADLEILHFEKESPGVEAFIRLGVSEVNASKNGIIFKKFGRLWLLVSYLVLKKLLKIEMERIYLTNLISLRKRSDSSQ